MQKTTSDNFVFEIIPHDKAIEEFKKQSLYILHNDDSESLIHTMEELMEVIGFGEVIGVEVGFLFI